MPHSVHTTPRTSTPEPTRVSYWNENIPKEQWSNECPEWLLGKCERDVEILSTRESDYQNQSWLRVQELIKTNRLDLFERRPTDLRRYFEYIYNLKKSHGSVLNFIQHERLHWDSITPSSGPRFANPIDYKILVNDWPYGIDPDISHLVVWTKFAFEEDDSETGDLTKPAKAEIEEFVRKTFCGPGGVERENLVWFKNWAALKSVHAIEHFHVMVYKAPQEYLRRMTDGDQPLSEKVRI